VWFTLMLSATLALNMCNGVTPEVGPIWAVLTGQLRNADLSLETRRDIVMTQHSPGDNVEFDLDVLVPNPPRGTAEILRVAAMDGSGNRSEDCVP